MVTLFAPLLNDSDLVIGFDADDSIVDSSELFGGTMEADS